MAGHNIAVHVKNGEIVCTPPETTVLPGDVISWAGSNVDAFSLESKNVGGPLFTKGDSGPFKTSESHTVNSKPPLRKGDRFKFKGGGDIIIG
jgi:hypothetical protein